MPDEPAFLDEIPELLGVLDGDGFPPNLDSAAVAKLLGCTRRHATRHIAKATGARETGWSIPRASFAAYLEGLYRRHGGEKVIERRRRILRGEEEAAETVPRELAEEAQQRRAAWENVEVVRGGILIRCRNAKEYVVRALGVAKDLQRDRDLRNQVEDGLTGRAAR